MNRPVVQNTDTHTDAYEYTDTVKQETKSKRLYLLTKPSVHQTLNDYAKSKGDTFNNLVNTLMEQFIRDNNL
jgi:tRNA A37 methylthiotransferase MiaB